MCFTDKNNSFLEGQEAAKFNPFLEEVLPYPPRDLEEIKRLVDLSNDHFTDVSDHKE